jgi:hypothetical protein
MIVLAVVCAAVAAPIAGAGGATTYFYDGQTFKVRPMKTIDISGTGSWMIGKLRWRTWTPTTAVATGVLYSNTCTPTCAAGHFSQEQARVQFTGVTLCKGKRVFTTSRVTSKSWKKTPLVSDFHSLGYLYGC